jgi:TPP-dependent pyruvate/acetoin dehydrogenase alpha subunit
VDAWDAADPLARLASRLVDGGILDAVAVRSAQDDVDAAVAAAVEAALRLPPPPASTLWDDVASKLSPALRHQRDEAAGEPRRR